MNVEVSSMEIVVMHVFLMRVDIFMIRKFLLLLLTVEVVHNAPQDRVEMFRGCTGIFLASVTPAVASTAKKLDWDGVTDLYFVQVILRQVLAEMIFNFFVNSAGFFKFMKGCAADDWVAIVFTSLVLPVVNLALLNSKLFFYRKA